MTDQPSSANQTERETINLIRTSLQLSTKDFVFEPNEANTWITAKSMIANYLVNLWKSGKLAGSSPEEAFDIAVGLGSTMTPDDILESRMIIHADVAIKEPGKFTRIVIEHKMQAR